VLYSILLNDGTDAGTALGFYFTFHYGISTFVIVYSATCVVSLSLSPNPTTCHSRSAVVVTRSQGHMQTVPSELLFGLHVQRSRCISMLTTMLLSTLLLNMNPQVFYNYTISLCFLPCSSFLSKLWLE
jgi:hypothetical protein